MKPSEIKYVFRGDTLTSLVRSPIVILCETPNGVGFIDRKKFTFSAGEIQVRLNPIPENSEKILITADVHSSETLVELLLILDAINRVGYPGPVELTLPYLPYSRQDRACVPGESFSLSVLASCLVPHLGSEDTLVTWDAHSNVAEKLFTRGFREFNGSFQNVSAAECLRKLISKGAPLNPTTIVIAPDKGAVDRASEVQRSLGLEKTVYATKVRNPDNGEILRTEVSEDVDYKGRNLLIVDDICEGGRTFIEHAKVLRKYEPSRIDLYVTHGTFSKGFDVFGDLIDHFYVANILPNRGFYEKLPTNLTFLRQAAI